MNNRQILIFDVEYTSWLALFLIYKRLEWDLQKVFLEVLSSY